MGSSKSSTFGLVSSHRTQVTWLQRELLPGLPTLEGLLGGEERHWSEARLRVTLDRSEIRRDDCPYCLTVILEDSLFVVNHVDPMSEVELELSVEGMSDTRILSIRRYSADGGTGNLIDVRYRVRDTGGAVGHANFQLQRR